MNILFINHYNGPNEYCSIGRTTYFAREWAKLGHDVTIVGASFSHAFFKYPQFSGSRFVQLEKGVRYVMLKTPKYEGNSIGRLINIFTFLLQLWRWQKWLAGSFKPDVVIAGSAHTLDCYPAVRLARRCGALFVREVRDLWPLTLTDLGGYSEWHPLVLFFRSAENFSYRHADLIVTTLPNSREYMQEHGLKKDGRWIYIPQGVDFYTHEEGALPEVHRELLERLNEKGIFILGYAGSIGLANCLDTLIETANIIQDMPVAFVLIGRGAEKENLQKKADQLGLKNVYFLPRIPQNCVPGFLNKVSSAFISWKKRPLYRYGISPNKLMDYMSAGKPIIHAVQASNDMVAESGCGISVPPEDPSAIAGAIREMMSMTPRALAEMGKRGREYVMRYHDNVKLAVHFLTAIEEKRNRLRE
jgi:glycosyltransferase involved in cell wall biosynthesis